MQPDTPSPSPVQTEVPIEQTPAAQQPVESTAPYATQEERQTPVVSLTDGGFDAQSGTPDESQALVSDDPVDWQAQEYISPDKNVMWYAALGVFVVAIILLDVLLLHAYTVSVLVVAIAAVLIVMSVRPGRMINYTLTDKGLYVGEQLYSLADYKAFGIVHDGKENSILLIPVKRFKPGLSVYFPLESGEAIVDLLGTRLPLQEIHLDFVDRIVRLLRL